MPDARLYQALKDINLNTVRTAISEACYRRSSVRAFAAYARDLALYLGAMAGVFACETLWAKLLFGVLAGCAVAFMFVWAHDAAHGALFENDRVAELFGTLFMLPSLNVYRLWCHGHNRVHHGFTSFSPIDWIWRPMTPHEYAAAGRARRFVYRLERSPYTCALHYLLQVWWPGMVRFQPDPKARDRRMVIFDKWATFAFALVGSVLAWRFGGGLAGVAAAIVVPFIVFNYFIALFVYLHHTHPDVPYFDHRPEWSNTIGQVYCSLLVRCSRLSEALVHNIMIHVPHHVEPRIPYYHLVRAYTDLKREYGEFMHEYRFRWATVRMIFARCKLYDFDKQVWYTFRDGAAVAAEMD